jgi:hypothetical protein
MTQPPKTLPRTAERPTGRNPRGRLISWLFNLAACALIFLSLGSYYYHRRQLDAIAAGHLRLLVMGPAELHAEVPAEYAVTTTTVTGAPLTAKVEMALYGPDGKRLLDKSDATDEQGQLLATVPPDLALAGRLPCQAQLRVAATRAAKHEEANLPLAICPPRWLTRLWLDQPQYRPGQMVRYRSVTLSQFGLAADRPLGVRFEICNPDGRVVPDSPSEAVTDRGVAWGAFPLPPHLADGVYTLVARSLDGSFPDQSRAFRVYHRPGPQQFKKELRFAGGRFAAGDTVRADLSVQRSGGRPAADLALRVAATIDGQTVFQSSAQTGAAGQLRIEFLLPKKLQPRQGLLSVTIDDDGNSETVAEPIPLAIESVDVRFYPEGGDLVAGVENRVYFSACDREGRPVALRGTLVNSHGDVVASVEARYEGLGWFALEPQAHEGYSLRISEPSGVSAQPTLPAAPAEARANLNTGTGVFAEGAPLEFSIRASKAGLPLVVTACCRGVPVGQQLLVSKAGKNDGQRNPVVLPLDESVGGVIRLCVFDFGKSPPELLAQRLVYRRMPRHLSVRAIQPAGGYAPGSHVDLTLAVANEKGEPAAAALGVAVLRQTSRSGPRPAGKPSDAGGPVDAVACGPGLAASFLLAPYLDRPEEVAWIDDCLSGGQEAETALDLLLGTRPCRLVAAKTAADAAKPPGRPAECIFSPRPPAVLDNLDQLQAKYEENLAEYRAKRTRPLDALITLSFLGGLGLLLGITILGLLKGLAGARLWVPALLAAASCAVGGGVVRDASWHQSVDSAAVAFRSFCGPSCETAPAETAVRPGGQAKAAPLAKPAAGKYAWRRPPASSSAQDERPEVLYWDPLLISGRDGTVQIHFDLPDEAQDYRVFVQAIGEGQLGSAAVKLVTQAR